MKRWIMKANTLREKWDASKTVDIPKLLHMVNFNYCLNTLLCWTIDKFQRQLGLFVQPFQITRQQQMKSKECHANVVRIAR